ncbi:MAG: hypothetical protein ABI306_10555 [Caulobacteraceae bacterium]
MDVEGFIERWTGGEGSAERANYQLFLAELCDVPGVARPEPAGATHARNDYVLEKLRAGAALSAAEEDVKRRGRVLIVKELHETIDALTAAAYGWPADLSDARVLENLVALNAARAAEEAAGHIRWLRPDYQVPRFAKGKVARTGDLDLAGAVVAIDRALPAFPADRLEQPLAVEARLAAAARPMTAAELARGFKKGGKRVEARIAQTLITLTRYGRVVDLGAGRYAARRAA